MILLDSLQILSAVSRSLEAHVLPELKDEFARVQIGSALKALQEIRDRIEHGDPCERLNREIEAGAREIAAIAQKSSPQFAARLVAALDGIPDDVEARERNRLLGRALWGLVAKSEEAPAKQVLALLHEQSKKMLSADNVYICGEAIASLT